VSSVVGSRRYVKAAPSQASRCVLLLSPACATQRRRCATVSMRDREHSPAGTACSRLRLNSSARHRRLVRPSAADPASSLWPQRRPPVRPPDVVRGCRIKPSRKAAARSRKGTPGPPCATTSRRTTCARRTRWPFSEPTVRTGLAGSPGVCATASRERDTRTGRQPLLATRVPQRHVNSALSPGLGRLLPRTSWSSAPDASRDAGFRRTAAVTPAILALLSLVLSRGAPLGLRALATNRYRECSQSTSAALSLPVALHLRRLRSE
jgi:hypothetical protein